MALGGGTFVTIGEKKLPGSYINFVSASRATLALSERGFAAVPLVLDWGESGKVITLTAGNFQDKAFELFGFTYSSDELKPIRELFLNARTLFIYRLGSNGVKASGSLATAKHTGILGNKIKIVTTAILNGETTTGYQVKTYLDNVLVDTQEVNSATATTDDLTANDFVDWIEEVDLTAGTVNLSNGTNPTITSADYVNFLSAIEPYAFNAICYAGTDSAIKALFAAFTHRMRDELGIKFQCVLYNYASADYEGIVSVENTINNAQSGEAGNLVYWVTGAIAGCAINKSNTNKKYNGAYDVNVSYTQSQLENALDTGKFVFHKVGDEVRVLEDINTLTTFTDEKSEDFKYNQTIRVIDQIGNDVAAIFNERYLGQIPNDESGRVSLWNDIVKYHKVLDGTRAIENFSPEDITVEKGPTKKSVVVYDNITPTNCMAQLYMICKIQ